MELPHSKSRFHKEHVVMIRSSGDHSFSSYKRQAAKALLPDPALQYQILPSPSHHFSKIRHTNSTVSVIRKLIKFRQSMDILAHGIREHVNLGPKLSEIMKGKLSLGARILQVGGVEKVLRHHFAIRDDEKLLKASQCYLSTTGGPIAGLLFISSHRIAFCSERSIKLTSPSGKPLKLHYKVMIPLRKVKIAIESENLKKPTQKYVQIVTEDNFDFWFLGFLNHWRTLNHLQQAIHLAKSHDIHPL